jgi:hypothetical protein
MFPKWKGRIALKPQAQSTGGSPLRTAQGNAQGRAENCCAPAIVHRWNCVYKLIIAGIYSRITLSDD